MEQKLPIPNYYYDYNVKPETETLTSLTQFFPATNTVSGINTDSYLLDLKLKHFQDVIRQATPDIKYDITQQNNFNNFNQTKRKKSNLMFDTPEKVEKRLRNAEHMREYRKNLPDHEKERRRLRAAQYMREFRKNLPEGERVMRRRLDTERMRRFRNNLTEFEKEIRKQKAKERMRKQRELTRLRSLASVNGLQQL